MMPSKTIELDGEKSSGWDDLMKLIFYIPYINEIFQTPNFPHDWDGPRWAPQINLHHALRGQLYTYSSYTFLNFIPFKKQTMLKDWNLT